MRISQAKIPTEHDEQVALFDWANVMSARYPVLELIHAIPNGGLRNKITARKLKKEGVKAGVPDVFLPVARSAKNPLFWYSHGLYIEMKRQKGGTVTENQKWWHEKLREQGYLVKVCKGYDEAVTVISEYLGI